MVSIRSSITVLPAARDAVIDAERLEGGGHPADEPPAADGRHHGAGLRGLLGQLQPDRALPGDDQRVVERRDERGPRPFGVGQGVGQAVVEHGANQDNLGAIAPGGGHLGERRSGRHEDGRPHPEEGGRQGHPLGVVAGAGRHDAGGPFGRVEPGDAVVGAPDLERARPLEVLGLEEDGPADEGREMLRPLHGGVADNRGEEAPGRLDVVQRDERGRRGSQDPDPTAGIVGGFPGRTCPAPDPPSAWR
jgi:hypothetical protein